MHSKVSHPKWQILVGTCCLVKHDTVSRTVHRFQAESLLLDADLEHVLGIVVPVAGGLPQLGVVDVWTDNLLKASLPVLLLDEGKELVVDVSALGLEKAGPWREFVEEEKILLNSDLPVVSLCCLLLEQF